MLYPPSRKARRLEALNRASIALIAASALLYAIGAVAIGLIGIIGDLADGHTTLNLFTDTRVPTSAVTNGVHLVAGSYRDADVAVTGLSTGVTVLNTTASVILLLTQAAIALSVAYLGRRLYRGDPFRRSVTRVVAFAACALLVGGALGQISQQAANLFAVTEMTGNSLGNSVFPIGAGLDPTFFVVGLALGLVAAAFEASERLQKETEGLV